MLKNGVILVRFDSIDTRDKVLMQGLYQFDEEPFIVKPWHEDFQKEKINQVPVWVWVQLGGSALSELASLLVTPIMTDKSTQEKSEANYASVLIEVQIQEKVPKFIYFENENGILIQQEIVFEWEPVLGGKCKKYGHASTKCKKDGHCDWRPKPQLAPD